MATTFTWDGFDLLNAQLERLIDPDATPLMVEWEHILVEDNRRGVLAGLDKDGDPMPPVTYRPRGPRAPKRVSPKQRNRARSGRRGVFAGIGVHEAGTNNNLTRAEYERLSGPPLAPRGAYSRVITNYLTAHGRDGNQWFAAGAWFEVVSTQGVPFLEAHFDGAATGRNYAVKLPVRNLRGVRPEGIREASEAVETWITRLLES